MRQNGLTRAAQKEATTTGRVRAGLRRWAPSMVALASAVLILGAGAYLTHLGPWYHKLRVPDWKPADWMFGPAWTLIFALWIVAVDVAWRHSNNAHDRLLLVGSLAINGGLNILWSVLFFSSQRPDWALIEVGFLWFSILLVMYVMWRTARWTVWLIVPYLAWASLAALLNLAVVRLNYDLSADLVPPQRSAVYATAASSG